MTTKTPRGIRNNNPLNIRIGNAWRGEVANPTDPSFEQFKTMQYGLRAGFVLLRRYINHYRRTTVPEIIKAWAPAHENNTNAYIKSVLAHTGLNSASVISFNDMRTMCLLVQAMCKVECGVIIPLETIEQGYDLATT